MLDRPMSRGATASRPHSRGSEAGTSRTLQVASNAMLARKSRGRFDSKDSLRPSKDEPAYSHSRPRLGDELKGLSPALTSDAWNSSHSRGSGKHSLGSLSTSAESPSRSGSTTLNGGFSMPSSPALRKDAWRSSPVARNEETSAAVRLGMLMSRRLSTPDLRTLERSQLSPCGSPTRRVMSPKSPTSPFGKRGGRSNKRSLVHEFDFDIPQKEIKHLGQDEKIFDLYHWSEVLQESGDGGKVVVCEPKGGERATRQTGAFGMLDPEISKLPKLKYVMKMRSKESLEASRMSESFRSAQLRLLNMPPHPGVLAMHEVLEDSKFYYVVMEKASGGSFFNGLMREFKDGVMPPDAVKRLMREILHAIGHVHQQGMLHRDIKPDNLVMRLFEDPRGSKDPSGDVRSPKASKGSTRRVALIDFDHAELEVDQNGRSPDTAYCGTYQFSAPETFLGKFSCSSDLYSIGVILYLLMTGKMPYDHPVFKDYWEHSRPDRVYHSMKEASVDWSCSPWPEQPECMEFCQLLLAFDPRRRCESAEQALGHEWLVP